MATYPPGWPPQPPDRPNRPPQPPGWPSQPPSPPLPGWPARPRSQPAVPGALGGLPGFLQAQLFERRVVLLTGYLDNERATEVAAQLMTLDAAGDDEPVTLYVDCPDATLDAAFVVVDTLKLLRPETRAHCLGRAGGPAVAVVAVADRRTAAAHARFRLAQPELQTAGTADQLSAESRQFQDLLRRLQAQLAESTGQPLEEVALDLRRGRYLDAAEARAYGLIDAIGGPDT